VTTEQIKAQARELGFELCGVAPATDLPELAFLSTWLARRYYGTMTWLPRTKRVRSDVRHIVPGARSVIVTGTLYNTESNSSPEGSTSAAISRYAWGDDYHHIVRSRLDSLLTWMRSEPGPSFDARAYVDTGPVQERVYAMHAGLGWIGKNTCLINPSLGSWLFLGVIITTLALDPDEPGTDQCGTCQLCLQSCPTGALVEPRVLDARLCISYLTIEKRGSIDASLRAEMGTNVYGCDICQDVCPYNSRPVVSAVEAFRPRDGLHQPSLVRMWRQTDAQLEALVAGTAMTRAPVASLRRNIAIAIGNASDRLDAAVLDDADAVDPERPSLQEPGVREAVDWARGRLAHGPHALPGRSPGVS
jgi:epoxyqueuosine reductase